MSLEVPPGGVPTMKGGGDAGQTHGPVGYQPIWAQPSQFKSYLELFIFLYDLSFTLDVFGWSIFDLGYFFSYLM